MAGNKPFEAFTSKDTIFSENLQYTLQDISHAVLMTRNLPALYASVHGSLNLLMGLPNFYIAFKDTNTQTLQFAYYADERQGTPQAYTHHINETGNPVQEVLRDRQPLLLKENTLKERKETHHLSGPMPKIWLGTPLCIREEATGVMWVQHYTNPDYFSRRHLEILTCAADMLAIAVDRKQLFDRLNQADETGPAGRDRAMENYLTLTGGMAHDFNNLITGIMGNLDLLNLRNDHFTDVQKECIANALESSRHAASLARQLQTFTRPEGVLKSDFDLYEPAKQAFQIIEATTTARIKKQLDMEPGKYFINGYKDELVQVFVNLGLNGIQAIEEKGPGETDFIRLYAETGTAAPFESKSDSSGSSVRIRFQDSGCGMSPQTRENALMPMFSGWETGMPRKHQGLGLSMVDYIVTNRHNGILDIQSGEGKGTLCRLCFPLSKKNASPLEEQQAMPETGTHTVLVIEDEDMVREMTVKTLTSFGYDTLTAENGKKAVEIFKERHASIDAVLLDVIMPEMSGTEAFRRMLDIDPDVKVVITSGHITNQDQRKMFSKAKAYLDKPFQIMELKKIMAAILS